MEADPWVRRPRRCNHSPSGLSAATRSERALQDLPRETQNLPWTIGSGATRFVVILYFFFALSDLARRSSNIGLLLKCSGKCFSYSCSVGQIT